MHTDTKILPFSTAQGDVPGHEIRRYQYDWMTPHNPITNVVFEIFSQEAQMPLEVLVHWTRFTQYTKRMWPNGGSVCAVQLQDGSRIHCSTRYVSHYDGESYLAAPIICRDVFKVISFGGQTMLEVVGVNEWAHSKRDAAATEKFIIDPWARDNAAFHAEMEARRSA